MIVKESFVFFAMFSCKERVNIVVQFSVLYELRFKERVTCSRCFHRVGVTM